MKVVLFIIHFILFTGIVFSQPSAKENTEIALKYFKSQEYDKTIKYCDKAISIDSLCVEAYIYRGICKSIKGNDGLMDLNRAIYINPENSKAFRNRAVIKHNMKDYDSAINDYKKAIDLNPEFAIQYTNLGLLYVEMNLFKESIPYFTESLKRNPKDSETYLNRGSAYLKIEDYINAEPDLNKAIKLNKNDVMGYYNLSIVYYRTGRIKEALKFCEKAIKMDPNIQDVQRLYGYIKDDLKKN
ncbi:MAG: hypothetical protein COB15_04745 [Flavobacteriales bacterium]|nr:MAG: hypothetical protein COB15_04745 [Flavobacteriales bacterium]